MYKSELKTIGFIFLLVSILFVTSLLIPNLEQITDNVSPLGKDNVLSFFKKRETKYVVYGYLPYWTMESDLDYSKYTHVAYFGLRIDKQGNFLTTDEEGNIEPGYENWFENETIDKKIEKVKKAGSKFALTIISHNDEISDAFLNCRPCWENLARNVRDELSEKNIRDLNINFEYVSLPEKEKALKYSEFVNYINKYLDFYIGDVNVIVATFADSAVKDRITDISSLQSVCDGLFIMAYDFHRPDSDRAGPIAPIEGKGVYAEYDIKTMLDDYMKLAPPSKLILGIPFYGYNWVVKEQEPNSERIPGNDDIGYSQSQTYSTITELIDEQGIEVLWDNLAKAPYFSYVSPSTFSYREVYFENQESVKVKTDLIKEYNLGGVGIWALGYDSPTFDLSEILKNGLLLQ